MSVENPILSACFVSAQNGLINMLSFGSRRYFPLKINTVMMIPGIACDKIVANDAPQIGVLITKRRIGAKIPTFNTKETTWNTAYVTDFPSARITPDETKKIILNMQPPVIRLM